jgi:hypothetical protein
MELFSWVRYFFHTKIHPSMNIICISDIRNNFKMYTLYQIAVIP